MIVVTGAAGFIAGNLVRALLREGLTDLLLVDRFPVEADSGKAGNVSDFDALQKMDRDAFPEWFTENAADVSYVFHLGARTDTGEFDFRVLDSLNLSYSKTLWEICTAHQVPILYASSAATYGMGEHGFADDESLIPQLKPLNPYGLSKQLFDVHVLHQKAFPPFWVGLKFFNVYGPYESHKGRMASVIYHAYHQIRQTGRLKLFQSHDLRYKDGEQLRDFIYVDDVVDAFLLAAASDKTNGQVFNLGSSDYINLKNLAEQLVALAPSGRYEIIPFPEDRKAIDIGDYYSDFSLFQKTVGWTPKKDLLSGLALTVKYYQEHGLHYW